MSRPTREASRDVPDGQADRSDATDDDHNLRTLAGFHIALRAGWIFKVESVIMPAVLDMISGSATVRGWLPILNKLAQSSTPLLLSSWVQRRRRKARVLTASSAAMSLCFLLLAGLWSLRGAVDSAWLTIGYLTLYTAFFAASGLSVLAFNTAQGKLVPVRRRGRLLWLSGVVGSVLSVLLAVALMPRWLAIPNDDGFLYFFLAASVGFAAACGLTLVVRESADEPKTSPPQRRLAEIHRLLRSNRDFCVAAVVCTIAVTGQILFPHYQSLGRSASGFSAGRMLEWILVQNVAVGIYSPVAGVVADRYGNRRALRIVIALSMLPPLLMVAFARDWLPSAWFSLTFLVLGLAPVLQKTIFNYVLELVPGEDHPLAIATMQVCLIGPFVFAPVAGAILDRMETRTGLSLLGGGLAVVVGAAALGTIWLAEPRKTPTALATPELPAATEG